MSDHKDLPESFDKPKLEVNELTEGSEHNHDASSEAMVTSEEGYPTDDELGTPVRQPVDENNLDYLKFKASFSKKAKKGKGTPTLVLSKITQPAELTTSEYPTVPDIKPLVPKGKYKPLSPTDNTPVPDVAKFTTELRRDE